MTGEMVADGGAETLGIETGIETLGCDDPVALPDAPTDWRTAAVEDGTLLAVAADVPLTAEEQEGDAEAEDAAVGDALCCSCCSEPRGLAVAAGVELNVGVRVAAAEDAETEDAAVGVEDAETEDAAVGDALCCSDPRGLAVAADVEVNVGTRVTAADIEGVEGEVGPVLAAGETANDPPTVGEYEGATLGVGVGDATTDDETETVGVTGGVGRASAAEAHQTSPAVALVPVGQHAR